MRKGRLDIGKVLREVIDLETAALRQVRAAVNGSYTRAVRLLAARKGKIIVTGTGKSGLIAQKVASTLASTGSPAVFLHPTDANHGELGIIQKGDVVLAFGKSGESDELNGVLPSLRKMKVPVVAVTANPRSTLARYADIVLNTPVEREACPLNLSPTCSTTAALAVGDALAIALMKLRGLTQERFALIHPAGRLGKRLTLRVSDIMRGGPENPVVKAGATVSQMLVEMTRKHAGAVSVVDPRGRFTGLVTDYDVRRALEKGGGALTRSIAEIMNPKPTTVAPTDLAAEAARLMTDRANPFLVLPVVDARRRPVGMIHLHDIRSRGL